MKRFFAFSILAFLLFPASGSGMEAEAPGFMPQFIESCNLWQVPLQLVLAIARHESAMNPWAVNVAGQSYMFRSRDEALKMVDLAWKRGYSFDVGLMQVNSYWMRRFGLDPHLVLEPKTNIILGTWILSKEIERFGLTWRAVASYHTPLEVNPDRGRRYAAAVIRQITKIRR
jgi:soluble lytic murein transglycosylase-like protein